MAYDIVDAQSEPSDYDYYDDATTFTFNDNHILKEQLERLCDRDPVTKLTILKKKFQEVKLLPAGRKLLLLCETPNHSQPHTPRTRFIHRQSDLILSKIQMLILLSI